MKKLFRIVFLLVFFSSSFLINIVSANALPVPFNLDLRPSVLETAYDNGDEAFVVTWGIKIFENESQKQAVERFIDAILTYPDNWQKTGLQFTKSQTQNKYDSLIWLRFYSDSSEIEKICMQDNSLACSQLIYIVDLGYRCYINMPEPEIKVIRFRNLEVYVMEDFYEFSFILSHEVGHCIGLSHMGENGDLMHERISRNLKTFTFPNSKEINAVKLFMLYIQTRYKDRYIFNPL
ncbi:MAG: hypothetical protein A3H51_00530 [Candidatus Spechtbacteria bacterium RIFCSPLOWO2_02_FULL_38_8]|uniref:Peptidase M10 metallopeptidase domain-containing protein n=1 Tax=Candidatus Spechtbacteria bacterium RIFCSPLOWO2_02_FULL_38_8 TaxID=1802164 RepID=A0A1G2HJS7_9BACT|nr:MAG: hypothetical protein A3H51_00530 [Candidatus Spechtbacteria bacterium RIFCSPLOWO2_02_FULL_38_8]